jgi:hypothetical protein
MLFAALLAAPLDWLQDVKVHGPNPSQPSSLFRTLSLLLHPALVPTAGAECRSPAPLDSLAAVLASPKAAICMRAMSRATSFLMLSW